jgi:peptidoglycan/LPS O-acetylase OafA/YrhL
MVFFDHYAQFSLGGAGVDIFFVLSGFLITGLLFDQQHKPHRYRNFYMRRTLRIFPLFYGVWLGLLFATPLLHIHVYWRPLNLLWPLYLGNYIPAWIALHHVVGLDAMHVMFRRRAGSTGYLYTGHFWSLCVEEQFYLFWPWVVFQVRNRARLMALCVTVIVASPLSRATLLWAFPAMPMSMIHSATPLRLDEFLMGGLAALILRGPAAGKLRAAGPWLLAGGVAALAAVWTRYAGQNPGGWGILADERWLLRFGFTLFGITSLGLVLTCLNDRSWLSRVFLWRPLRELGKVSYGFYVFHDIPRQLYSGLASRMHLIGYTWLVVPFAGTLALSFTSFYLWERPFLLLKTRFEGPPGKAMELKTGTPHPPELVLPRANL